VNPVKQLISQLSMMETITGQVQTFEGQWVLISMDNRIERWPNPGGIKVGDIVKILNGRIIKAPTVEHLDIFQV